MINIPFSLISTFMQTPWTISFVPQILDQMIPYSLPLFLSFYLRQKVENICQYGCWDPEIPREASLDTIIKIQEEPNFLYVCQSVSWLIFLLKLHKYWDISSSERDIV